MTWPCVRSLVGGRLVALMVASLGWSGLTAPASALSVLLVTQNNGSLTSEESARQTTFQGWGHTVTTAWDGASQATFDTAMAAADLVYVSEECSSTDVAYKLRFATIGVVVEEPLLDSQMGFATSDGATTSQTQINLVDPASGLIAIFTSAQPETYLQGTVATGFHNVGETPAAQKSLGTIEAGSPLANTYSGNSRASGRRLRLPWGGDAFAFASLNSTGLAILQNGLVWAGEKPLLLHWKLDSSSGTTATDSSTYARTGTLSGTGSWVTAVRYRGASLAGAGKIEVTSLLNNPVSFSLAAWVNVTALDTSGAEVVSVGDHSYLRVTSTAISTGFYNGSGYTTITFNTALAGNGWHHLAATFDEESNAYLLYLNGVQVGSATTTAKVSYAGLGTKTTVGAHGNASTAYDLNGIVDDVRAYNKALTAAEVLALYGPTGYWKLDETSGTAAADSSGAGNTGTYSGAYVLGKPGVRQYAVGFGGGTTDLVSLPRESVNGATSLSVAFWMKTTNTGTQAILSGAKAGGDNEFLVYFNNSTTLQVMFHQIATSWTIPTVADGKWHHFAITTVGESSITTVYRDGLTVSAQTAGPGGTALTIAAGGLIVGQEQDSVGGGFQSAQRLIGDLDDLRIYNRALSAQEVADVYGLMSYWKFDEGAGTTIADSSGAGRNAAFNGGAPTWVAGVRGSALNFNGTSDDAITNANFSPPAEGTVAFWFKSNGPPSARQRLFGLGGDWEMWQDPDGYVRCDLCVDGNVGGFMTASTPSTAGAWYYLAAVYDAADDSYAVYVNGVLDKSGTSTANIVAQAAARLSFGTRTGTTERFSGTLDDFRIYNRKLSQGEIYQLYGLEAWYKLDELSGTVASDSTGVGNDGVYVGSPSLGVSSNGGPSMGTAVAFNGSNYVQVTGLLGQSSSVSISGWAKLDAKDTNGADLVSIGDCFLIRLANSTINTTAAYHRASGTTSVDASGVIEDTGWHHFAAVLDAGNTLKLYIDGNEKASVAATAAISYSGLGANTFIGRHGNSGSSHDFTGRVDDVRIFNRPIKPNEVYQLYRGSRINGIKILTWTEAR